MLVCEVNPLKHFGFFTSGGKINSLKQKELCKQIYFEYTSTPICFKNFFLMIEFKNSIIRLSFLSRLLGIQTAWINHSHKKRKDSLDTRAEPAVFSL